MVCKDCRSVETVDVGVGDNLIVQTVEIGVGDGVIDPEWVPKGFPRKEKSVSDTENKETKIKNKSEEEKQDKTKPGKCNKDSKSNLKTQQKRAKLKIKIKLPIEQKKSTFLNFRSDSNLAKLRPNLKTSSAEVKPVKSDSKCSKLSSPLAESDVNPTNIPTQSKSEDDFDSVIIEQKRKRIHKKEECKICKRLFRTTYLKQHMLTHEEDDEKKRPYRCEKCDKRFANLTNYNNHLKVCGNSQSVFQCHICQKNLCNKHSLEMHIETHSSERTYKFQCHLCARLFKNRSNLNNHIKSHDDSKPFPCNICQKGFKDKRGVKLHKLRFHEKIFNKFECDMCDKVFRQKCRLSAHRDEHKGIKRFKCDVCEKQFGSYNVWKTHLLIHKEKKRFSCSECGKGFNHGTDLKRHMSTHTGIKPFRCDQCGRQFIHKVYLVRHKCTQNIDGSNVKTENQKGNSNFEIQNRVLNNENQRVDRSNYGNSGYLIGERSIISNQISCFESDNRAMFQNELFHHL